MWYIIYTIFFVTVTAIPKTDEEYKQEVTKNVMKCTKDFPVEMKELFNLEKMIIPESQQTKCLLACAYRADNTMTKDGKYNKEYAVKVSDEMSNGDAARKKNIMKLAEICDEVNEKSVTDGEKGCDRAAYIFKCITENAPKLGFKI